MGHLEITPPSRPVTLPSRSRHTPVTPPSILAQGTHRSDEVAQHFVFFAGSNTAAFPFCRHISGIFLVQPFHWWATFGCITPLRRLTCI